MAVIRLPFEKNKTSGRPGHGAVLASTADATAACPLKTLLDICGKIPLQEVL
jgi:hypothetical protein